MSLATSILEPREPAIDLVRIISEGTYTSFSQALKEFISNAYDADAKKATVTVDEDTERIVIRDDGVGMTAKDFGAVYASIARRGKGTATKIEGRTALGRKKIGRFGIGALAVAGVANRFTVRSTKRGERGGFQASIDLARVRSQFGKGRNLSQHWRFELSTWKNEAPDIHFTEVTIEGLKLDIWNQILRPGERQLLEPFTTARQLSGVDHLRWRLGLICPVRYMKGLPFPRSDLERPKDNILFRRAGQIKKADFHVELNDKEVFRPIYLPSYEAHRLDKPDIAKLYSERGLGYEVLCTQGSFPGVEYEGYIATQASQIVPEELRGILIRIRGVAVGSHRPLYLSSRGLAPVLASCSGEIWVVGLDEALQFDRESFREEHPKYVELCTRLTSALNEEAKKWRERSAARTKQARELRAKAKRPGAKTPQRKKNLPTPPRDPAAQAPAVPLSQAQSADDQYVPEDVFEHCRSYIVDTARQINGCWHYGYFEACAVMIRRLLQILIIELYSRRGWQRDLKDPASNEYLGLKRMIGKLKGDPRFGVDKRIADGLNQFKELGDIAAHDYRIRVRKSEMTRKQDTLQHTCERLLFHINQQHNP